MTVGRIIGTGLDRALDIGFLADLPGGNAMAGALKCLKEHFTLDGRDLAAAFQDSLGRGAGAIALGLCDEGAGVLTRLGRALSPNLARSYAAAVERDFLLPYGADRGLSAPALASLRRRTLDACQILAQRRAELLPAADLNESALATLAQGAFRDDLSAVLLARAGEILPDLDAEVRGLLAWRGLLGDALLWFLREQLRADPRVCATLEALQREGLWADLRDLKAAQAALTGVLTANLDLGRVQVSEAMQSGDFARAAQLSNRLQALAERRTGLPALLEQAQGRRQAADGGLLRLTEAPAALGALVEIRLDDLAGALTEVAGRLDAAVAAAAEARDAAQAAGSKVDAWGDLLHGDLEALGHGLGARLDLLPQAVAAVMLRVLRPGNLGLRITPGDEFTAHDGAALGLIRQAQAELASLPPGPAHSVAALAVGSALSSTGAAAAAEALFRHAAETAATDPVRALAAYNLFQARLRQGPQRYPEALEALRQAVALDPARYATHEEWKYQTQAILGAGGMGCAFLCREPVKGNRPVVVKTFWRAAPGAVEATFAEAMTMDRVGRGHVPALLGYGFAQGGERPYIVMEYLDGYRDGEAWLTEQGPLPLAAGLDLGRRVLLALAAAHAAGVVHLDLKPSNLLLKGESAGEGGGLGVKVIDFGLARVAERVDGARVAGASRAGLSLLAAGIAGTWDYASPEQLGRTKYGPPGPRSDLYAFGATWWRLLTGRHPNNRRAKYLPPGCPAALFELIHDLLEHDPKDRPESAAAVLAQLDTIVSVPVVVAPERAAPARPKPSPVSEVPDIHGWPAAKVQALQQAAAQALERPVVFRDREFRARGLEEVQTGQRLVRKHWFRPDEYAPVYEEHETTVTIAPPEMVVIPAGRFLMGSPEGEAQRLDREGPQHPVTISRPFAIGRYAVTFDDYDAFCVATGRDKPGDQGWGRGRCPVINVTWNDAVAYCQWLSEQTGRSYRLPTEAEWEYACRAATATAFYFGATVTADQANYDGNHPYGNGAKGQYRKQTVPVGSLPPNPWGLCEMHGNVWEWCQDWFGDYEAGPIADPGGPTAGLWRVARGGSWFDVARDCRSARRLRWEPADRGGRLGFRLARGPG